MSPQQKSFACTSCQRLIYVPWDLPQTQAPCPHCGAMVVSPALPTAQPAVPTPVAPVEPPSQLASVNDIQAPKVNEQLAPKQNKNGSKLIVAALAVGGVLIAAASVFLVLKDEEEPTAPVVIQPSAGQLDSPLISSAEPPSGGVLPRDYEEAPQAEIEVALERFLQAKTIDEKLAASIPQPGLRREMEEFYRSHPIYDDELKVINFHHAPTAEADRERGLYMMTFYRHQDFDMRRFFRPLPELKVQLRLQKPDILMGLFGQAENFQLEEQRIRAFFLKGDDGKMRVDWPTFIQGQYRTLRDFCETPQPGVEKTFRVWISQDITIDKESRARGVQTYRVIDTSHPAVSYYVLAEGNSQPVGMLKEYHWLGDKEVDSQGKTATVKLKWEANVLMISEFICYEFAGLGADVAER